MLKLTDTQLVILSSGSQRDDRGVDLPTNVTGEAVRKAVDKLIRTGLLEEVHANGSLLAWRRDAEAGPMALRITTQGLEAIGVKDVAVGTPTETTFCPAPDGSEVEAPAVKVVASRKRASVATRTGDTVYGETLNIAVWVKSNAGQGSFYRSQHELIGVFRVGDAPHLNNVELGRHGRSRSNVWHYGGMNTFRAGRLEDLKSHPTVKPVTLVSDAMRDCTRRGDIVVDTFSGSGTTILASERVGRRAFALEIEPRFVDVAIRRWQAFTRKDAIHLESGRCFDELAVDRIAAVGSADAAA